MDKVHGGKRQDLKNAFLIFSRFGRIRKPIKTRCGGMIRGFYLVFFVFVRIVHGRDFSSNG